MHAAVVVKLLAREQYYLSAQWPGLYVTSYVLLCITWRIWCSSNGGVLSLRAHMQCCSALGHLSFILWQKLDTTQGVA